MKRGLADLSRALFRGLLIVVPVYLSMIELENPWEGFERAAES